MKQVIQNYKSGNLYVDDVPMPRVKSSGILVRNKFSLISTGTERSKIATASKNIIAKAKARPDQVKQVLNNIKQEGLFATIKKALIKIDTPISLGYSSAGVVLEVSSQTQTFKINDRVACMGEGFATHSEVNFVPDNLCVKISDNLTYEQASFVGLGAIAMQGVRNACIQKGHKVGVIGLGLIGQLSAQILQAFGCECVGIDLDSNKLDLAKELKIAAVAHPINDDAESLVSQFTQSQGLDSVIITAASKDSQPINLAAKITKKYGHVILVGLVPIQIPRKEFFDKELTFIVSHGFGDESSAQNSMLDGRIIWSAKVNAQDFLGFVSRGLVNVDKLISHQFTIENAKQAYELLSSNSERILGVTLNYDTDLDVNRTVVIDKQKIRSQKKRVNVGFIGAGSFSTGYLLPILSKNKYVNLKGVATTKGISSKNIAEKFKFDYATTEYENVINDASVDCIIIATRHDLHGSLVLECLKKNKIVFVEKPLCINPSELDLISKAYSVDKNKLMIGFNRRFSPFVIKLKEFFINQIDPLIINYRINAGRLDGAHWLNNLHEGGGRIVGEVCHFVDFLQFITESEPIRIFAEATQSNEEQKSQSLVITIKYKDNSVGSINYNSIGDLAFPRERIEVFGQDSVCVIDNFRRAEFIRNNKTSRMSKLNRDMGYQNEINSFVNCVLNKQKMPIGFKEIVHSTYSTFKIIDSLKQGQPIKIDLTNFGL